MGSLGSRAWREASLYQSPLQAWGKTKDMWGWAKGHCGGQALGGQRRGWGLASVSQWGQGTQASPTSKPGKLKIPLACSPRGAQPFPLCALLGLWEEGCEQSQELPSGYGSGAGRQAHGWFREERKWRRARSGNRASEATAKAHRGPASLKTWPCRLPGPRD